MKTAKKNKRKGFTIIEILLVLALLGMVASFVLGDAFDSFGQGQVQAAKIQIKRIEGELDRFRLDCNFYPYTGQGLDALVNAPSSGRQCPNYSPKGYIKKIPKDPWDNDFIYNCEDGANYTIVSLGADGVEGGEDDNADISSED